MAWIEHFNLNGDDYSDIWLQVHSGNAPWLVRKLRQGNTRQTFLANHNGRMVIVKYWYAQNWRRCLLSLFKTPDAAHEFNMTSLAVKKGRYCQGSLSYAEDRRAGFLFGACLIHPVLPSMRTAMEFFAPKAAASEAVLLELSTLFGREMGLNHAVNLLHNDYKLDNIIVDTPDPNKWVLHVIDWGLAREIAEDDTESRLDDLIGGYRSLANASMYLGTAVRRRVLDSYLHAYAEQAAWFGDDLEANIHRLETQVSRRTVRSSQRQWERAFAPARRRRCGRCGKVDYIVFGSESDEHVRGALGGEPSPLACVKVPHAAEVWRAANVLRCVGVEPAGVIGICAPKANWKKADTLLLRRDAGDFVPAKLIARAKAYCQGNLGSYVPSRMRGDINQ